MIKKKRLCSLALVVALLSSLCACGRSGGGGVADNAAVASEPAVPGSTASEPVVPDSSAPTLADAEPIDLEPTDPDPIVTTISIDIPWTDATYSVKDYNGYTFDITLHLSPWILLSDTDLINSAWDKVSGGNALPQFDDWGFTRSGNAYKCAYLEYFRYYGTTATSSWYMTDMYYSVGTVTIQNTTSGFDITQNEPRSVEFQWGSEERSLPDCLGRIIYSNDTATRMKGLYISASMTSNTWGPVPVILMVAENISPNTPDGVAGSILADSFVFGMYGLSRSENAQVHLGILKSDGEYITQ